MHARYGSALETHGQKIWRIAAAAGCAWRVRNKNGSVFRIAGGR